MHSINPKLLLNTIYVSLLFCSICSTMLFSEDQNVTKHKIPRIPALNVDGDNNEWEKINFLVSTFSEDTCPPLHPDQCSNAMKLAWNDEGLAVFIQMTSNEDWIEDAQARTAYKADSIELFLRQGSAWAKLVQAVIAPGFDKRFKEPRIQMWDYRRGNKEDWAGLDPHAEARNSLNGNTGSIEVLIPWKQLKLDAKPGLEVEFRANINKVIDGSKRRQFTWRRSDGDFFQKLILSDEAITHTADQAAWIDSSDERNLSFAVSAAKAHLGNAFSIKQGENELFTGKLSSNGDSATATLSCLRSVIDYQGEALSISLDGKQLHSEKIKDPTRDLELALERIFIGRTWRSTSPTLAKLKPRLPFILNDEFDEALPQAYVNDPDLAKMAGVVSIKTTWYDNEHTVVTKAEKVGRYGAVTIATLKDGRTFHNYHTAVKIPNSSVKTITSNLGLSLDHHERVEHILNIGMQERSNLVDEVAVALHGKSDYPTQANAAWIHKLRTKLGTHIVYPYNKRMPSGYDDDKKAKWPAIIYLHGSNGRLPSQQQDINERVSSVLNRDLLGWSAQKETPFARYALLSNGGWEPDAVLDTVDRILAEDRIDPDRLVIMGFSMGGMGTWRCLTYYPERWAAAVPIGGRGDYAHMTERFKDKPIWIFNGDVDHTTTLEDAMHIYKALQNAGSTSVKFTTLPNVGHGGSQNGTYETPGLWEWMEAQKRK